MIYRSFAGTNDSLSVIGFGASPLGNVFGETSRSMDDALVAHALACGINFFDVSPYYGLGLAEERLGAALAHRRQEAFLATKCGRYGADNFDFSAATIVRRLEESLQRLQTDYVDLLQAHDIEFGNMDQILHETLPALAALKKQGKCRYIGITGFWPGLLSRVADDFQLDAVLNYCHANLFVNDMDRELIPLCSQRGIAAINASPLHMGLLGDGPVADWHPAPAIVREKAAEVVALCRRHGVPPGTLAVWKCLQHPTIVSTLVGLSNIAQIDTTCRALEFQPSPELLSAVEAILAPVLNMRWPQGRIENQDASFLETPAEVNA